MEYVITNGELYHHGIKGQKWGVRRFQNADGTFNAAGKKRYFGNGSGDNYKPVRSLKGTLYRMDGKAYQKKEDRYRKKGSVLKAEIMKSAKEYSYKMADKVDKAKADEIARKNTPEEKAKRAAKAKKALKIGAIAAGAALAAYGGYKLYSNKQAAKNLAEYERQQARREAGEKALRAYYDKQMRDAWNNPNLLSYTINDSSINYHNSWSRDKK